LLKTAFISFGLAKSPLSASVSACWISSNSKAWCAECLCDMSVV
jgi:hypothetical protein